jgi:hypothetical protein
MFRRGKDKSTVTIRNKAILTSTGGAVCKGATPLVEQ